MKQQPPMTRREFARTLLGLPMAVGLSPSALCAQEKKRPMTNASDHPLPTYHCPKVKPFTLDGDLTKPVWKSAPAVKLVSATGKPQKRLQPTTLRACWSDTHLYVGFHCEDTDIWATYTKRDERLYNEDVVEVFLCASGDLRYYDELEFSPRGTLFDARVVNPTLNRKDLAVDTSWDCAGLQCAIKMEGRLEDRSGRDKWWAAEIAIPFAGLGVESPSVGARWRANFYRIDYATPPEFSAWSPTLADPANYHLPERFGWLVFTE